MKNWKTNEMIYFYSLEDIKPGPGHIRDSHGITPPPLEQMDILSKKRGVGRHWEGGHF